MMQVVLETKCAKLTSLRLNRNVGRAKTMRGIGSSYTTCIALWILTSNFEGHEQINDNHLLSYLSCQLRLLLALTTTNLALERRCPITKVISL